MKKIIILITIISFILPLKLFTHGIKAPDTEGLLVKKANILLDSLFLKQKKLIQFDFNNSERYDWHYIPTFRIGLPIKDMNTKQRALAMSFLKAGLSYKGYYKASNIMKLESILHEIEMKKWLDLNRDPELYYFSFFGNPSANRTWGWRVEGHHISLNMTIVDGVLFSTTPRFLGTNPAQVKKGKLKGLYLLKQEEVLARKLINSFSKSQKKKAIFRKQPFKDIVTLASKQVSPLKPVGISVIELKPLQKKLLINLLKEYASTFPLEIAKEHMKSISDTNWEKTYFGWAGSLLNNQAHYYRIQTPTFLIEYDNVQDGSNHIHTIWRDFNGDFGRDLLKEHYHLKHKNK